MPQTDLPATCGECEHIDAHLWSKHACKCGHPSACEMDHDEDWDDTVYADEPPPHWCPLRKEPRA